MAVAASAPTNRTGTASLAAYLCRWCPPSQVASIGLVWWDKAQLLTSSHTSLPSPLAANASSVAVVVARYWKILVGLAFHEKDACALQYPEDFLHVRFSSKQNSGGTLSSL
ncbi:hypothetical protein ACLOJK_010074 [Asimina triloba]